MSSLSRALAPRSLGGGRYAVDLDEAWAFRGHPHGGFLAALLTQAAVTEVGGAPLVANTSYLAAPQTGTAVVTVRSAKAAGRIRHADVQLEQDGVIACQAGIVLGTEPPGAEEWSLEGMPLPAPYELCSKVPADSGLGTVLAVRYSPGLVPRRGEAKAGGAQIHGWVESRDSESHPLLPLIACDALASTVSGLGRTGWAPTLTLNVQLRRPWDCAGPLSVSSRSRLVTSTYFDETTTVRNSAGHVLVHAQQLALLPRPPHPPGA